MEDEIIRLLGIKGLPRCVAKQIVYLYNIDELNKEIDKVDARIDEFAKLFTHYSGIPHLLTVTEILIYMKEYPAYYNLDVSVRGTNLRQAGEIVVHEAKERAKLESLLEVKKKLYLLD